MFGKLYIGEMKKILRPKTMIILSIILVFFLIIYAIAYNFQFGMTTSETTENIANAEEMEENNFDIFGASYNAHTYTEGEVLSLIEATKSAIEETDEIQSGNSLLSRVNMDMKYQQESYLKALEYIRDNNLYGKEIELYSPSSVFKGDSAEGFMSSFFMSILSIMMIFAIVVGAGSYTNEIKNGTLKMLFMRPITRNKLTTAKLLAMLSVLAGITLISVLISYLYGLVRYGAADSQNLIVIYVFNAMSAFQGTKGLGLFFTIIFGLIQIFAIAIFSYALGTLLKNKAASIILGIVVESGIIALILTLMKMGRFLFTTSYSLGLYFGITYAIPAGGNFFIALPVFIAYISLFLAGTYLIINKRDLA